MKKHSMLFILITVIFHSLLNAVENNFLNQFISSGDLVFDVGANIGKKTIEYLQLGATVVCFEPQPDCASKLRQKFSNASVYIEEKGLADKPGILTLTVCTSSNTISTFSDEWQLHGRFHDMGAQWNKHIQVEVVTLDAMIAQYGCPTFCKIDVENFEYEVLKGLTHPIPALSFEFAIEMLHNTKKCLNYLISLGYRKFNFALEENQQLFFNDWVSAEQVIDTIERRSQNHSLIWGDIYAKLH